MLGFQPGLMKWLTRQTAQRKRSHDRSESSLYGFWICGKWEIRIIQNPAYRRQRIFRPDGSHWTGTTSIDSVYNPFYNQSCGDYTLVYLGHRAKGKDLSDFFKHFSKHD